MMGEFKSRLKAIMAKYATEESVAVQSEGEQAADGTGTGKSNDGVKFENTGTAEDLITEESVADVKDSKTTENEVYEMEVLTATTAEIELWHAYGSNGVLQQFLLAYDGFSHFAPHYNYDKFKVGFDEKRNCATLAVDATHYVIIPFSGGSPENMKYADFVLKHFAQIAQSTTQK